MMLKRITGTFVAGVLALLPLLVTIGLVLLLLRYFIAWFGPESSIGKGVAKLATVQPVFPAWLIWVTSIAIVLVFIWVVGWLAKRVIGKRVSLWIESIVARIPFLNKVYKSVDQVVELIAGKGGNAAAALSNVVLVKFANTRLIGMLAEVEPISIQGEPHYFVYIPSAPVPTSGFNYLVPCVDVVDVNISVEELSKIIVSLGSLGPSVMNKKEPLIMPRMRGTGELAAEAGTTGEEA